MMMILKMIRGIKVKTGKKREPSARNREKSFRLSGAYIPLSMITAQLV
jgi:hypothetical protein